MPKSGFVDTFVSLNSIQSRRSLVCGFISMTSKTSSNAVYLRPNLVELWALFEPKFAKSGFVNTFVCLNIIRFWRNLVWGFISIKAWTVVKNKTSSHCRQICFPKAVCWFWHMIWNYSSDRHRWGDFGRRDTLAFMFCTVLVFGKVLLIGILEL